MSTEKPLTPRQKACLKFALEHRKGIRRLPPWMTDKYLRKGDCPLFHYGVPVPVETLVAYGVKNGLLDDDKDKIAIVYALSLIVSLLAERCRAPLRYALVSHTRHFGVVALHNNLNVNRLRRSPDKEDIILQNIRDELGLSPNSQPLWYYDFDVPHTENLDTVRCFHASCRAPLTLNRQRHTIPKIVIRHVKKKFGSAYLHDKAELESSDEELKAKLTPDAEIETEAGELDDEESGTETDSSYCDQSTEMEISDVGGAVKT